MWGISAVFTLGFRTLYITWEDRLVSSIILENYPVIAYYTIFQLSALCLSCIQIEEGKSVEDEQLVTLKGFSESCFKSRVPTFFCSLIFGSFICFLKFLWELGDFFSDAGTNSAALKSNDVQQPERERSHWILQNFAKALWNVLKEYKEKLKVVTSSTAVCCLTPTSCQTYS